MPDVDEQQQQDLIDFLYACPVGLVEIDAAGAIGMMNPHAMKHLLPIAAGRPMHNLFDVLGDCAPELRHLDATFGRPAGTVCENHRIAVALGEGRAQRQATILACTLVRLRPDRAIATLTDVTRQVAQEERLRQAETWFASLIDGVNDYAVLSLSPEGRIETVNPSFARQTGFGGANLIGLSLDTVLEQEAASAARPFLEQLRLAERDGWYLDESWQTRADGSRYWCQRLFAARIAPEGTGLAGFSVVLRDVPRRAADVAELRRLLTSDQLTGAANRSEFRRVLEREQASWRDAGQPLALVLLDLDHFKAVNDQRGHPAGDLLLRGVADACAAKLRPDELLARIGGEEFAVLLPGASLEDAHAVAETLRGEIARLALALADGPLRVTASLGCASMDEAAGSIDALIACADRRLYVAKARGRNRVCAHDPAERQAA